MNSLRWVTTVVCFVFLLSSVLIPFASADWTMFRSDPTHIGVGAGNPVLNDTLIWNFTTGGGFSSPTVENGVVYVGSRDNKIYALNATKGNQLWNYTTGNQIVSSPTIVNKVVYVGSRDDNVYALNATNGAKIWSYTTGGGVDSSPAVFGGIV